MKRALITVALIFGFVGLACAAGKTIDGDLTVTGTLAPSGNVTQADAKYIATDETRARDSGGLKLYDDGGNGIFVKDGGNVGIGTASPSQSLQIVKDQNSATMVQVANANSAAGSAAGIQLNVDAGAAGGLLLFGPNDAVRPDTMVFYAGSGVSNGLKFESDVGHIVFMPSSGNVGIGTTSPGYELEVSG
ncbi:MAG: hypothetical protein B6244_14835, partial [Candidatus Cloacimonetes bacterium 4572_55]